jgi:hypothetical protein
MSWSYLSLWKSWFTIWVHFKLTYCPLALFWQLVDLADWHCFAWDWRLMGVGDSGIGSPLARSSSL